MTISILRLLIFMLCAGALFFSCPSIAQVYSGVNAEGTLVLSNFNSGDTPTIVVPGPTLAEAKLQKSHPRRDIIFSIPMVLKALVEESAKKYELDPLLLHAVIRAESGYNAQAISPKGARGLMQLMPDTGLRFGVKNLLDPRENLKAGAQYLRWLLTLFDGDIELALAGYNAGENAVIRAGYRVPPYNETRNYVPKVLKYYRGEPS